METITNHAPCVDWEQGDDGLLGITVKGESRFRILERNVRKNQLLEGNIEFIDDDENELPVKFQLLSDLLRQIVEKFELSYKSEHEKFMEAGWVGCRLAELLPLELSDKQELLEIDNPLYRLEQLQLALEDINQDQFNE